MITFFFQILYLEKFYIHSKIKRKVERFPIDTLPWYMHIFHHQQTYIDTPQAFKFYDYI